ncbi:hypothetical protein J5N97_006155 [Dioscorea zingiberensis]|uniref:PUM-HD domain-containing protein n=1 Tax=Dioscorea zingiberensis TaxID=325984 RepID=A0A9D5HT46_9LILI|nr:hypothetical protein J5N97_006155 [Dioscorea zingiberensis]
MLSDLGVGLGGEELGKELGILLREQRRQEAAASDRERELSICRGASAPPTVEGSLAAIAGIKNANGLLSEEELRSDPAYLSYCYSHVNRNPRLPPPAISKEDWRFARRFQAGGSGFGGIGDRRKSSRSEEEGGGSLFSLQPGFNMQKEETEVEKNGPSSGEWLDGGGDGLIGLSGFGLSRQQTFTDILQDELGQGTFLGPPSRPASRNAFGSINEPISSADDQVGLHPEVSSVDRLQPVGSIQSFAGYQENGAHASHNFPSVLGSSLSRSTTPDPHMLGRTSSPSLSSISTKFGMVNKNTDAESSFNGIVSSSIGESDDLVAALSGMSLSSAGIDDDSVALSKLQKEIDDQQKYLFDLQDGQDHIDQHPFFKRSDSGHLGMSSIPQSMRPKSTGVDLNNSTLRPDGQVDLHRLNASSHYLKIPSATSVASPGGSPAHYQNSENVSSAFGSFGLNGFPNSQALPARVTNHIGTSNLPPLFEKSAAAAAAASSLSPGLDSRVVGGVYSPGQGLNGAVDLQSFNRLGNHATNALHMGQVDPLYRQYLRTAEYAAQVAANSGDPSATNSYADLLGLQKAYLGSLLQPQRQYGMPFLGGSEGLNPSYYGNPPFNLGMPYPGSPLASPVMPASPVGPGSLHRHGERSMRFPSGLRNLNGGVMGPWHSDNIGSLDENFPSSLLEEFKSNKTRCLELSEIASHVVEFSSDQYGSRFIQQKLETATDEEKNMVFEEIMPQALSLMTDVFGNYVVQKFFEHGTAGQIRELADQLNGHVLALSLQMYGCRVIQKAIEVVDLDQQTKMVQELDGHIMRCVRDQNGNHVIQKCIECIPQDAIQFIVSSFYDQVVMLSTHPYGCRVIQRVLEHCDDPKTQQIVMDEIMQCVCMLAQDQYGNYVIQHVLEHGKPEERSAIIKQLAGQIVQMSQQKFASNVVEKCLTFGGPEERQVLVNEILGTTSENEPLQAMMKDQFGNYVVQKVLETVDDQQRELILSRIKVHLNALKKYTYGKHIVARVEKLVAAGERRIGLQSSYST